MLISHRLLPRSQTQAPFISRSDPARNQRPGSPSFNQRPPAQIHGSHFRSHHFREQAAQPPRPLRAAPGENPYGNQTPGTYAVHLPRHGNHHQQNRSRGPYVISLSLGYEPRPIACSSSSFQSSHIHLRQDVGHQQANPHSHAHHPWHGLQVWSIPSTPGDHGFGFVSQQMAWPTSAAAPAQPQGPGINEVRAPFNLLHSSFHTHIPVPFLLIWCRQPRC